jgi:hypothetical protein
MKIYNYNPENGYFVGESLADESPLESGVYLIPAHATEIAAPKATKGKVVVWNGSDWELQDLPVAPIIDNSEYEAKQAARIAVAERLGLTADEIKLLIG